MKKTKTLVASLIALVLCFTMVIGTTFAWFTDSVTNTNTIITSGNVDVELWHSANSNTSYTEVNGSTKLFVNTNGSDIIWEPGASATENFQIKNVGTLALKYQFSIKAIAKTATEEGKTLADILTLSIAGEEVNYSAFFGNGYTFEADILAGEDPHNYNVSIAWDREALKNLQDYNANDYNVTNGLKIYLGIELVATQLSYESDGTGNNFDDEALFPNVSSNVNFENNLQEDGSAVLQTKGENPVTATIPSSVVETLIDNGVESLALVHTEPQVDEEKKVVTFESVELVDENGNIIDLIENNEPMTVTLQLPVEFEIDMGMPVDIFHDGEKIASGYVAENGTITYQTTHFCEVAVEKITATKVSTADELVEALESGKNVVLTNDIKIDPANMSNAYGTTGINIKNGQAIFGAGYTLDIKGAGGTWDSGINTTGGLIKDITVTGSFRGIFINHNSSHSEQVVLENVIIKGTTYTISCDQGTNQGFKATNCEFWGWTSFAATLGNAEFVNCTFGEGNGYAYCRPYAPTTFTGCIFEEGFEMDARAAVTLENCTIGEVVITAENLGVLVTSNTANATIK